MRSHIRYVGLCIPRDVYLPDQNNQSNGRGNGDDWQIDPYKVSTSHVNAHSVENAAP